MAATALNLGGDSDEVDLSADTQEKPGSKASSGSDDDTLDLTVRTGTSLELPGSHQKGGDKMWSLEELKVIKPPILGYVPQHIVLMMRSIEAKIAPSRLEFGAFLKGTIEDGRLILTEDFLVLKQQVTGATIDFQEDPPDDYNGVIHRHPGGCKNFSGVDDKSINENYDFSLLYVDNHITHGIINLKLGDGLRLQVPLLVRVVYPISKDIGNIIENIHVAPRPKARQQQSPLAKRQTHNQIPFWEQENGGSSSTGVDDGDPDTPEEMLYDLGGGFTFDGTYIYDDEEEIVEDHDLPEIYQQAYMNAIMEMEELCYE